MSKIFVISGGSGVGKNTVIQQIRQIMPELTYIPSVTTRAMREGESQGNPYHFLTKKQFRERIAKEQFIEYNEVHGNFYGTDREAYREALENNLHVIKDIDVEGGLRFKERFKDDTILIYLKVDSMEELRKRLINRGDTADIEVRLKRVTHEDAIGTANYEHVISNVHLENTVDAILDIIKAAQQQDATTIS